MPLPNAKLIVIHGIQAGNESSAIKGPQKLVAEVNKLTPKPPHRAYTTDTPSYENYTDAKGKNVRWILDKVLRSIGKSIAASAADKILDVVGDVFIYRDSDDAKNIREMVKKTMQTRNNILVGHSLGSVIAFDIISDLMHENAFTGPKTDWPVEALVTFGSPLALPLFRKKRSIPIHNGELPFDWYNFFDQNDPIVTGNVFGLRTGKTRPISHAYAKAKASNWQINDAEVETGYHINAHVHYWKEKNICQKISELLMNHP